jgi:hypothetical protein
MEDLVKNGKLQDDKVARKLEVDGFVIEKASVSLKGKKRTKSEVAKALRDAAALVSGAASLITSMQKYYIMYKTSTMGSQEGVVRLPRACTRTVPHHHSNSL